jgi:hypothetical protein
MGGKSNFFASLKSLKKGVGSGVGSGFISQRYRSADPDPHQRGSRSAPKCHGSSTLLDSPFNAHLPGLRRAGSSVSCLLVAIIT